MTQRATMSFSTSLPLLASPMQCAVAKIPSNAHGSLNVLAGCMIRRYVLSPLFFLRLKPVRHMSSTTKPPNNSGENSVPDSSKEQKKLFEEKNNPVLENMFRLVRENGSKFQSISKQLSEKSSSIITRLTPDINMASAYNSASKEGKKPDDSNGVLNQWYMKYQGFIGITDLKRAQDTVTELQDGLLGTQIRRRKIQTELDDLQEQLNINYQRTTKTEQYSEEHYNLYDQARDVNSRLKEVQLEFKNTEQLERETSTQLSAAIRDCHERNSTQAKKSTYRYFIISTVPAAVAFVITYIYKHMTIGRIKDHVSANNEQLLEGYQKMYEDVMVAVNATMTRTASSSVAQVIEVESNLDNIDIAEETVKSSSSTAVSPMGIAMEDIALLTKAFGEILKEQVSVVLANETKLMQETIKPHLDAIFTNLRLILESNKMLVDTMSTRKERHFNETSMAEVSKMKVISPSLPDDETEKREAKTVIVDYGYRHITSAMAIGAGIGTLATAFFLGSFSGGTAE